jgi:two-component sensor histidine kinase/PAS domain-containing protein
MATLADRIRLVSDLELGEAEHLRTLCSSWQVLADLSFSDLLLYVPRSRHDRSGTETFIICAQLRPFTSQTLYPQDMIGIEVTQPEQPIVERAYREGRIWTQDDPVLVDGLPIRLDAVPVRYENKVIAVITKEGSPSIWRRPGRLEEIYLQSSERVSMMIATGFFPFPDSPPGDWPRVGDGLFVLDEFGCVSWASPNALSALRRMGVKENVLGRRLEELGVGDTPVRESLSTRALLDGELEREGTNVRLRVFPLLDHGVVVGGLVLARDVTEIRQKERLLSVKDATIQEIHHRVKNNLQTIASLLRLQGRRMETLEAKTALQESELRIGSIALVHDTLSKEPSDVTEFSEVASRITRMMTEVLVDPGKRVDIEVHGQTGPVPAEVATPLAVILAELLHNAIEHAFPGRDGTIDVELMHVDGEVQVVVRDDGIGVAEDALESSGLGLQIVRTLVDDINGRLIVNSESGSCFEVRVPASSPIRA